MNGRPGKRIQKVFWTLLRVGGTAFFLAAIFRNPALRPHSVTWPGGGRLAVALISIPGFVMSLAWIESWRLRSLHPDPESPSPSPAQSLRWYLESRPWVYALPGSLGADGVLAFRMQAGTGLPPLRIGKWLIRLRLWGLLAWAFTLAAVCMRPGALTGLLSGPFTASWVWWSVGGASLLLAVALEETGTPFSRLARLSRPLAQSLMAAALAIGWAWMAGYGVGVELSLLQVATLMALLTFASLLPLSIAGLGVQEALILHVLGGGHASGQLLLVSLMLHLQRLSLSALGLAVSWWQPIASDGGPA